MGASQYEVELDQWTRHGCDGSNRFEPYVTPIPAWTPQGSPRARPAIGNAGGPGGSGDALSRRPTASRCARSTPTRTARPSRATGRSTTTSPHRSSRTRSTPPTSNAPCNGGLWLCPQYYIDARQHELVADAAGLRLEAAHRRHAATTSSSRRTRTSRTSSTTSYTNEHVLRPAQGLCRRDRRARSSTGPSCRTSQPDGTGFPPAGNLATLGNKQVFNKQSIAPAIQPPDVSGAGVSFQWSPLVGAAYYTLQVSTDESFSNIIEDVNTDSASYTAAKSYPAGQTLYYRVRANDVVAERPHLGARGVHPDARVAGRRRGGRRHQSGEARRRPQLVVVGASRGDRIRRARRLSERRDQGRDRHPRHDDVVDEVRRPRRLEVEGARGVRQLEHHRPVVRDPDLHAHVRRADRPPHRRDEEPADHLVGSEAGRQDLPPAGLERSATSRRRSTT